MDFDELREFIPNLIARLSTNLDPRNYDLSNMGPRQDIVGEIYHGDRREDEEDMELGLMTPVNSISLAFFLCQLFDHFTIMFQKLVKGKGSTE